MKKAVVLILTLSLALSLLVGPAAAAAYTPQHTGEADILNELGLFKGTDKGYELDRTPSRTEALVLLIRLLGKDTEAKACNDANPFTDVDAWADRYVAWAYANGMTKGTAETTFGAQANASAQMFITFVLRALGYDDGAGDFNYDSAIDKAAAIGLIPSGTYKAGTSDFYRDDCVHLCYAALTAQLKSNALTLAAKLASDGAISKITAQKYGLLPAYTGEVKSFTIACVGDSLTFGMGTDDPTKDSYPAVLATLTGPFSFKTERYGHTGAAVDYESTGFAPPFAKTQEYTDSLNTKAEVIVIMLGTNDAVWSPNQTDFSEDYAQMLDTYIKLPQQPKVIAMLPPHLLGLKGYDDKLEKVVEQEKAVIKEKNLDMIDAYTFSADMAKFSKDGVHFTAEGYKRLAGFVYEQLGDILSK